MNTIILLIFGIVIFFHYGKRFVRILKNNKQFFLGAIIGLILANLSNRLIEGRQTGDYGDIRDTRDWEKYAGEQCSDFWTMYQDACCDQWHDGDKQECDPKTSQPGAGCTCFRTVAESGHCPAQCKEQADLGLRWQNENAEWNTDFGDLNSDDLDAYQKSMRDCYRIAMEDEVLASKIYEILDVCGSDPCEEGADCPDQLI